MSLIRKCDIHVNSFKETRQSKQLHPKTTPFFLERKNELPRAGFEPATCTLVVLLGNQDFKDPYLKAEVVEVMGWLGPTTTNKIVA